MSSVEILIPSKVSEKAAAMLYALRLAIPQGVVTHAYKGDSDWLIMYGVGEPSRDIARKRHLKSGRRALLWDLAYFHRREYLRCSIDHDHPQAHIGSTPPEPSRWQSFGIALREDADPHGHIVLVGLGRKSRAYLHEEEWERLRLMELSKRFPDTRIVYKPKAGSPPSANLLAAMRRDCEMVDAEAPIADVLRGASLVSCRHSNVAVDAIVAGVPYECDDGAAMWLRGRPYTRENRLDFLRRLAWWQWRPSEAAKAWAFVQSVVAAKMEAAA